MDVYYNGKSLPGKEIAKPVLKVGEPFNIGINLTVYQKCHVSVMLSEIGDSNFEIVNGPTSKMKDYGTEVLDKNSTEMYEWTVKPQITGRVGLYQLILFIKLMISIRATF